jgi:PAS domain S-box-containing protein
MPAQSLAQIVEMQRAVSEAGLDPDRVMAVISSHATRLSGAAGAVVELAEGDEMVYRAGAGAGAGMLGTRLKRDGSLSGRSFAEAQTLCCDDSETDPRVDRATCRRVGARSMVVVPLVAGADAMGVLKVFSDRPGAFDAAQVHALEIAAAHLGAALHAARQYRELQAERSRLRASQDRLQAMAANVPGMLYQIALSPEGQWSWPFVGQGCRHLFGVDPERVAESPQLPFELVHPEDREALWSSIRHSAATLEPWVWHGRVKLSTGERWVHGGSRPQRLDDGTVLWDGLLMDITDRQKAADEIRFQAHLLDSVQQAVIATDLEGIVTFWNGHAERLYGWTCAEALGRHILDLNVPEDTIAEAGGILAKLAAGGSWSGEITLRRKDGTRFTAHVTDSPIHDAAGRMVGIVGASQDVSDRKRLEEQLRQSQKMEAVGRLAGGVAHDFNNLLTAIQGGADLLLHDMDEDHAMREDVLEIRKASVRAAGLTRQLLAFSRRQVLQPRVMDLNTTLRDIERMLRRLIGEDVDVVTDLAPSLGAVRADPGQMEQVLMNLAVNARDAMPWGGTIVISTRNVFLSESEARGRQFSIPAGRYVSVSVSDSGVGIAPEHLPHIFEPFFTTKEPGKGTGLGLSTVYGIVRQSGGYVWAESTPGQGTTVRVYLPVVELRVDADGGAEPGPPAAGGETVLIVEDEPAVRRVAQRILSSAGYHVLAAETGDDALAVRERYRGPIDLVLCDVVMPGMGGPELLQRLTADDGAPRVLYMSGYTQDALAHRGPLEAATLLIEKPFPHDLLLRRVREALEA